MQVKFRKLQELAVICLVIGLLFAGSLQIARADEITDRVIDYTRDGYDVADISDSTLEIIFQEEWKDVPFLKYVETVMIIDNAYEHIKKGQYGRAVKDLTLDQLPKLLLLAGFKTLNTAVASSLMIIDSLIEFNDSLNQIAFNKQVRYYFAYREKWGHSHDEIMDPNSIFRDDFGWLVEPNPKPYQPQTTNNLKVTPAQTYEYAKFLYELEQERNNFEQDKEEIGRIIREKVEALDLPITEESGLLEDVVSFLKDIGNAIKNWFVPQVYGNNMDYNTKLLYDPLYAGVYPDPRKDYFVINSFTITNDPYLVEQTINGSFIIQNNGPGSVTLNQLLIAGRGDGGEIDVHDFKPLDATVLEPGESYAYSGTFTIPSSGNFWFWPAYLAEAGDWVFDKENEKHIVIGTDPVLTRSLNISPIKETYLVNDVLSGNFTVKNQGLADVVFDEICIGGRDEYDNVHDFTKYYNKTVYAGNSYDYSGTFNIPKTGEFRFFVAYKIQDQDWNVHVPLSSGMTETDRTFSIIVQNVFDSSVVLSESVPYGAQKSANQNFTQTWRIKNNGTLAWNNYKLVFIDGSQMSGSSAVSVSGVNPGYHKNISINCKAPSYPGSYTGYWQMQNANNQKFGEKCAVSIIVPQNTQTSWEFNIPEFFDGWEVWGVSDTVVNFDGHLVLNPINDPHIFSPQVSISTTNYNSVMIRMQSHCENTSGNVYMNLGSRTIAKSFGIQKEYPPKWHTYLIYFGGNTSWTGTIKGIRIDPVENGDTNDYDDISIDWIRMTNFQGPNENSLIQEGGQANVYVFKDYRLWHIKHDYMLTGLGYGWDDIIFYDHAVLNKYLSGPDILENRTLVRKAGSEPVYLLEDDQMKWITSSELFHDLGYKDKDIYVVQYDKWSNVKSWFPDYGNHITEPPEIVLASPNGDEKWNISTKHDILWTADDDSEIDYIEIQYSSNGGSWKTISSNESNSGKYSWLVPSQAIESCKVKVIAYDNSGEKAEAISNSFSITEPEVLTVITNIPPAILIMSGPYGFTNDNTPSFTWDASDEDGSVAGYYYELNDSTPDTWTTDLKHTFGSLEDGYYVLYVKAKDDSGDYSITSRSFVMDTTKPETPTVTDNGEYIIRIQDLHVSWVSSDKGAGIAEYEHAIGTAQGEDDIISWTSAGLATEITGKNLDLPDKQVYYFSVKAMDNAGNWSESGYSNGIILDSSLPVELAFFKAEFQDQSIVLKWQTVSEVSNLGFNVFRSQILNGKYLKINASLIPGHGTTESQHNYSFADDTAESGKTYFYYLEDIDFTGNAGKSRILKAVPGQRAVLLENSFLPLQTRILQNFPNPFNAETWIPYELADSADVEIRIFNNYGSLVSILALGAQDAGSYMSRSHAAHWDGKNPLGEKVSSGIYFYTLKTKNFTAMKRMILIK